MFGQPYLTVLHFFNLFLDLIWPMCQEDMSKMWVFVSIISISILSYSRWLLLDIITKLYWTEPKVLTLNSRSHYIFKLKRVFPITTRINCLQCSASRSSSCLFNIALIIGEIKNQYNAICFIQMSLETRKLCRKPGSSMKVCTHNWIHILCVWQIYSYYYVLFGIGGMVGKY